jgi:hypothetical protein
MFWPEVRRLNRPKVAGWESGIVVGFDMSDDEAAFSYGRDIELRVTAHKGERLGTGNAAETIRRYTLRGSATESERPLHENAARP